VTTFLACAAQSSHSLVPPDLVSPLVSKIANEFVSEAAASEVASAGLNAIREICSRQPLAMDETLLQDLVQYRKSKDKGVMMASKGLLSLYRKVGAELLHRRDRGKEATLNLMSGKTTIARFGEAAIDEGIAGIELLQEWKEEEKRRREETGEAVDSETEARLNEEQGWADWNVDMDSDDESGGWIDVASDENGIEVSDSDEERHGKKLKVDGAPSPAAASVNTAISWSNLATTTILTPADFAKLQELRMKSAIESSTRTHKTHHQPSSGTLGLRHREDGITAEEIEGLALLSHKATKEEKLAKAKGDKEERHLSTTAMRKGRKRAAGKSTSNKEKERQKNFLMTLDKAKSKGRRPLKEVRRVMKGHVERSKRGGRRGNKG
jgi:protein SDA1